MPKLSPIIQPIVTEKAVRSQEKGAYTFLVRRETDKTMIKKEIESLYGVEVASIKTNTLPKKVRLVGRGRELTKRPVSKKAIVTLKKGQTLDPNKFKATKKK